MFLAEKTVKNYVSRLLSKLGMARRSEAAAYSARLVERQRGTHQCQAHLGRNGCDAVSGDGYRNSR